MPLTGPTECPNCAYDPEGDTTEFRSGGGWRHSNSISDGIWSDELYCPVCGELVAQKEQTLSGHKHDL